MEKVERELAAIQQAGCFESEAESLSETVKTLLPVRLQSQVELAIRKYCDEKITLGRAAELAGVTRWRFQELLAQWGIRITLEARPVKELDKAVERIRRRQQ